MKNAPFLSTLFIFLLTGCSADAPLTVAPPTKLAASLLPAESEEVVYLKIDSTDLPDLAFTLEETRLPADEPPPKLAIGKEFLIPVAEPFRLEPSISFSELTRDLEAGNRELIPLSRWDLPGRGLLVEGLSPADADYPLVRYRYLIPRFGEKLNQEDRTRLEAWIGELETRLPELPPKPSRLYWMAGVGDMMLERGIESRLQQGERGLETIFSDLLTSLQGYDLLAGNLEGAVTRRGERFPKSYNFRFQPETLPRLTAAGFDYLTIANNHAYDYGTVGFVDTLRHLDEAGIPTSGVGLTPAEAASPAIFKLGETEVRFLGLGAFPPERNGFDGAREAQVTSERPGMLWYGEPALEALRAFAAAPGIDVVMVHGGREWRRSTDPEQRRIYRSLIDAGAEIVFGAHPHVLQGMEYYRNGLIYYSLGNFLFNGMQEMAFAEDTLVAELGILDGKILYRRELPVELDGPFISRSPSSRIIEGFLSLSRAIPPEP